MTSNRSTCIKPGQRCRGTAEIELMLSMMTMVTIFLLVWGALQVHRARQKVVEKSHEKVFASATAGKLGRLLGGRTGSHTIMVRPNVRRRGRWPRGFPGSLRMLGNEVYIGRDRQAVRIYTGQDGSLPAMRTAHTLVIGGGPYWTYYGPESKKTKKWYKQLRRYGYRDMIKPLKLAPDGRRRRGR